MASRSSTTPSRSVPCGTLDFLARAVHGLNRLAYGQEVLPSAEQVAPPPRHASAPAGSSRPSPTSSGGRATNRSASKTTTSSRRRGATSPAASPTWSKPSPTTRHRRPSYKANWTGRRRRWMSWHHRLTGCPKFGERLWELPKRELRRLFDSLDMMITYDHRHRLGRVTITLACDVRRVRDSGPCPGRDSNARPTA